MAEDNHTILTRLSLLSIALASITGCALPAQSLEAGADESSDGSDSDGDGDGTTGDPNQPGDECLLGSLRDSVGQVSEYWSPNCPVVCEDENAFAHRDVPLDIAWTHSFSDQAGPLTPGGMVRLANANALVVASTADGRVIAHAVDPAGQTVSEIELELPPTEARVVRMLGARLYVMHNELGEDLTTLSVFDDEGATWIASRSYTHTEQESAYDFDVSSLGVSVLYGDWDGDTTVELLDHELELRWDEPGLDWATTLRMGSTPELAIVMASALEETIVSWDEHASQTWEQSLLHDFVTTSDIVMQGERLIVTGSGMRFDRFDGRALGIETPSDIWGMSYGRAYSWCPDPNDTEADVATAELFVDVELLDDGTALLAVVEHYEGNGDLGRNPLLIRFGPDAVFLGRDRGLWQGYPRSVLAGPGDFGSMLATDDETGGLIVRAYNL